MTEDINSLFAKLEKALSAENVADAESFISSVASTNERSTIGRLLSLLEDNYNYDELMYSLIHAAENFDDAIYVAELIDVIPVMVKGAPEWASIVVMRSLNSDNTRAELAKRMSSASATVKSSMEWLLSEINKESPEFLAKTIAVLTACKS